ncbi:uncharacterized protein Ecym_2431 [Eremothecium cymbalariae DBVPG|uniref:Fe2OG dioxygenase domain-containing protein n=1 Tax=Eremothecium cymbalariae (strain CBS 270.75 / DBVPG 7215 / KCTC 17166 / NRRL Y-17582) TaxID=931890 RepID=G8JPA3_ERECY|nr:Hypothetical protein Ecym_2431 [Eremothecium cymbalariae DBVPG\
MAKKQKVKRISRDSESALFPEAIYKLNDDRTSMPKSYEFLPYPECILNYKVILLPKFFNAKICESIISHFSVSNTMESFCQRRTKDYAERFNDRASVISSEVANIIWARLFRVLQKDNYIIDVLGFKHSKGLNPQLRVYRYEEGHHFGKHYDESVKLDQLGTTQWTLLIYLSGGDSLVGGDTIFYAPDNNKAEYIHPSKGLALLHKHGDDCLLHEAQMVEKGVKWVLRSDVIF